MKSILLSAFFALSIIFGATTESFAQFSKVVTVVKGTVINEATGKPISVKVSVRSVGDTASEVTAGRTNSETGSYLVVLKPGKKYWFHIESPEIITKDSLVETPNSDKYTQLVQDFTVTPLRTEQMGSLGTAIEADLYKKQESEQN
jgi:hypothetical protein